MAWLPNGEKFWRYVYSFWQNLWTRQMDGRTDGRTRPHDGIGRAWVASLGNIVDFSWNILGAVILQTRVGSDLDLLLRLGFFLLRLSIICVIALPVLARCQHYTPTNSAMNLISPLWNKTQSLADVCVWTLWGQCFMISILWSCELSKEIKATRIYGFCCMFSDFLTLHNFYVLSSRHLTKYRKYLKVNSRQWIRVGMSVQPTSWGLIVGTAVTVVDETKTSRSTAECPWW